MWRFAADGPVRDVCWFAGAPIWGVQKQTPWSGRIETPARAWTSRLTADSTREARLSRLLRCGTSDFRRARLPDHGVRERPIASAGCHATPRTQGIALLRIQRESMPGKLARSHCVCEQRWCVWGVTTAGQSSFSQLKLSVVQAKAIRLQRDCKLQGRRQRFPTVRTVTGLGNSEQIAKSANIRACTSTACCERPWILGIRMMTLLKSRASRQEKASACNRNGATPNEHFCYEIIFHCSADVDAAGTKHLNSLLDDDGLAARCKTMTDEVSDGAARCRAGRWIFTTVELHAGVPICS